MWSLSEGRFKKPHMPMFNWEELSKMDSSILRTMRHITFGKYSPSFDGEYFGKKRKLFGDQEVYLHVLDNEYKVHDVKRRWSEEWPSEKWNFQDNLAKDTSKSKKKAKLTPAPKGDEANESTQTDTSITKEELSDFLTSIDGIGKKKVKNIVEHFGSTEEVVGVIHQNTSILTEVKGITKKLALQIEKAWKKLLK